MASRLNINPGAAGKLTEVSPTGANSTRDLYDLHPRDMIVIQSLSMGKGPDEYP